MSTRFASQGPQISSSKSGPVVRNERGRRATASSNNPRWTGPLVAGMSGVGDSVRNASSRPSTRTPVGGAISGMTDFDKLNSLMDKQNNVASVGGQSSRQSKFSEIKVSQGMGEYPHMISEGRGMMSVGMRQRVPAPSGDTFSSPTQSTNGNTSSRANEFAATELLFSESGRSKTSTRTAASQRQASSVGRSMVNSSNVGGRRYTSSNGSGAMQRESGGMSAGASRYDTASDFGMSVSQVAGFSVSERSNSRRSEAQSYVGERQVGGSRVGTRSNAPGQGSGYLSYTGQSQFGGSSNSSQRSGDYSSFNQSDFSVASGYDTASEFGIEISPLGRNSVGGRSNTPSQRSGAQSNAGQSSFGGSSIGGRSNASSLRSGAQSYGGSRAGMRSNAPSQHSGAQSYGGQSKFSGTNSGYNHFTSTDAGRSGIASEDFLSEQGEAFDGPRVQRDPSLQVAMPLPSTEPLPADSQKVALQILEDEQRAKQDGSSGFGPLGSLPRPPGDLVLDLGAPPRPPAGEKQKKKKGLVGKLFGR
jgi:hypothetical protein